VRVGRGPWLAPAHHASYDPAVRRAWIGFLVGLGLVPLVAAASPDAGQSTTAVPTACTGLPAGAELIPGLVTGQAATSGGTVTLRFSNESFACGEWLTSTTAQGCQDVWAFTLTVPADAMQPGVHSLSALFAQFGELYGTAGPPEDRGCTHVPCTYATDGIGSVEVTDPSASLEIYSADPQCITGAITGLTDVMPSPPDHNGAFFALACPQ
jgi:hypothetical protein